MHVVKYTKHFIDGCLEGMTYDTETKYPTLESATKAIGNLQRPNAIFGGGWFGPRFKVICSKIV
ncbi:MAG: hypothetical protein QXL01_00110 [Thermoplasmatales archaeon]